MYAIEAILHPLDRVRHFWLKAFSPLVRPLIIDRERRVAFAGSLAICVAFSLTILSPLWLLALGPIVLGALHLLADARYLVVRTGLSRRWSLWLVIGLPMIWLTSGSWVGFCASIGALLVARAPLRRKAFGLLIVVPLVIAASYGGRLTDIIFVHAHNFVAVAFFFWWTKRRSNAHYIPLGLFFFMTLLLLLGVGSPAVYWSGGDQAPSTGMELSRMALTYSPTGVAPEWALRFLLMYAFAQAMHYTIWLRLIPEEDRERRTPRTFVQSYEALREDLGVLVLALFMLFALLIAGWALVDISAARLNYLEFARFHGYVELAIASLLIVEGRPFASREALSEAEGATGKWK
jgi:hypothetical protein